MIAIKRKYGMTVICKTCDMELDTGLCYTKLGRWLKTKLIMKKHWHTKAEVVFKNATGIYMPTVKKKWEE